MSEGNAPETRGHLPGGEKGKRESTIGKQEFDKSREEAKRKMETGEDTEGNFLFTSLKDSFTESPDASRLGAVANTYKEAKNALSKIEDPAELEKAIISLRSFHESVGLGKYLVNIETDASTTPEQRRELIKQKVAEDVASMPEQFAIHELSDYLDHRARTDYLQGKITSTLPVGKVYERGIDPAKIPPRQYARLDAYEMQREADKVYWAEQRIVDKIADDRITREFHDLRNQRLSLTEDKAVKLSEKDEEERNRLINERIVLLKQQIEESKGKKPAEIFENLSDDEKKDIASRLIDDEEEIRVAGKNFETSVRSEDADKVTSYVSNSKEARVKHKGSLAELDVMIAAQRTKDASSRLTQIRRKIALAGGKQLERQHLLKKEEINEGLSALKEKASSFIGEHLSELKGNITPVIDDVMQKAESADDALLRGVVWVGERFDATVGRAADAVKDRLREARDDFGDAVNRIAPGMEKRKLNLRRNLYDKRHALSVAKDRALSKLGIAKLEVSHKFSLKEREFFGGKKLSDEEKKMFGEEMIKVGEAAKRLNRIKAKEHDRRRKEDNPHFEYFWKEIDRFVVETKAVSETSDTSSPEDTEQEDGTAKDLETVLRSEVRPLLTDYEILKYRDKDGSEHNILVWTDDKNVRAEEIDEKGTFLKALTEYQLRDGEDANEIIDRSFKELTDKYDEVKDEGRTVYKRGLKFSKSEDGSWVIVEEGKDEEFKFEDGGDDEKKAKEDDKSGVEKKKKGPMTEEEREKMYPGLKGHEIVRFKDKKGNEQSLLGWWDGDKFKAVMISRYGRRYGKNLAEIEAGSKDDALKLFNELIAGKFSGGQKYERGFYFGTDKERSVKIEKAKEESDKNTPASTASPEKKETGGETSQEEVAEGPTTEQVSSTLEESVGNQETAEETEETGGETLQEVVVDEPTKGPGEIKEGLASEVQPEDLQEQPESRVETKLETVAYEKLNSEMTLEEREVYDAANEYLLSSIKEIETAIADPKARVQNGEISIAIKKAYLEQLKKGNYFKAFRITLPNGKTENLASIHEYFSDEVKSQKYSQSFHINDDGPPTDEYGLNYHEEKEREAQQILDKISKLRPPKTPTDQIESTAEVPVEEQQEVEGVQSEPEKATANEEVLTSDVPTEEPGSVDTEPSDQTVEKAGEKEKSPELKPGIVDHLVYIDEEIHLVWIDDKNIGHVQVVDNKGDKIRDVEDLKFEDIDKAKTWFAEYMKMLKDQSDEKMDVISKFVFDKDSGGYKLSEQEQETKSVSDSQHSKSPEKPSGQVGGRGVKKRKQ